MNKCVILSPRWGGRVINISGSIFVEQDGPGIATGNASIVLLDGIALIFFDVTVTTSATNSTSKFFYGIWSKHLQELNSSTPWITPVTGGIIDYETTERVMGDYRGYGGVLEAHVTDGGFWLPARVYQTNGAIGGWGCATYVKGLRMNGVAMGTY